MDLAFERSDWIATPAAQALLRNNRPLLAWLTALYLDQPEEWADPYRHFRW